METKKTQGKEGAAVRTRRAIIKMLKEDGPMDALRLAEHFGVSGMAVRQHLYNLQKQHLVTFTEEPRSMGRPAKMWRLTREADRLFPDGYADLTVSLIESLKEAFGEEGLEKMLEIRNRKQVEEYLEQAPAGLSLHERLEVLAQKRTAEGYMAEIIENPDGSFRFVEKHCPICAAAAACSGLCRKELEMLQDVLGDSVHVERADHIVNGASRCVYLIKPV